MRQCAATQKFVATQSSGKFHSKYSGKRETCLRMSRVMHWDCRGTADQQLTTVCAVDIGSGPSIAQPHGLSRILNRACAFVASNSQEPLRSRRFLAAYSITFAAS